MGMNDLLTGLFGGVVDSGNSGVLNSQEAQGISHNPYQQYSPSPLAPPLYIEVSLPLRSRVQVQIQQAISQIPVSVLRKIKTIRFGPEGVDLAALTFEVVFSDRSGNERIIRFANLDTFPTDADIARICFEAP